MNKHIKDLEQLKINPIIMHHHQAKLRRALLDSSYWDRKQKKFLFWKGGEEITRMKKFTALGAALCVIILSILYVAYGPLTNNSQTAYAEQLAQESSQAVLHLTPAELQTLKQKLPMDPNELLQEAKNAKDLKTLTYNQFVSEYPQVTKGFSTNGENAIYDKNPSDVSQPQVVDMHTLKFLQFTDPNGDKVVLGIDQNNLPSFAFEKGKNGSTNVTVHGAGKGSQDTTNGSGEPIRVFVNANNQGVITVNGKKYSIPAGIVVAPGNGAPPSVQMKGDDVYINGVKATPE